MKILNLYAGIGGNRLLWGNEHKVTAVEINPKIAKVYQDLFPNDEVIVADAHEYLLKHFKEFDFIWSSPPCQTHSRLQFTQKTNKYPDMSLYQEILLLQTFYKGKFVIENVRPCYKPLIDPTFVIGRHVYWSSNKVPPIENNEKYTAVRDKSSQMMEYYNVDISKYKGYIPIRACLRNMVKPEHGLYILNEVLNG